MFLVGNQMMCIILNLSYYILLFYSIKLSRYKMGIKTDKDPFAVEKRTNKKKKSIEQNFKCFYCLRNT